MQRVLRSCHPRLMLRCTHSSAPRWTTATSTSSPADGETGQLPKAAAIKRLLYRSKQRGFLELDLLMGLWADRNASSLTDKQLDDLTSLLEQENPDLFKWLTGQAQPPPELLHNSAFQLIRGDIQSKLQQHSPPSTRSSGAPWVRGWDDQPQPKKSD